MDSPDTGVGFDRLALAPAVLEAVQGLGYETPTPIQSRCIPHLLAGRDLLGQAQTGTGKTAAFALPLLSRIEPALSSPQVLVLTPTRELALQVAEAFQRYARGLAGFHVLPIYGGQSYGLQVRQLERGAQVIVGTPGRVMDHLRRGHLRLDDIRTLVLDEADEMLNMGFAEDIEWIFERAPAQRQVALFSATMPKAIRVVADRHLVDPVVIKIEGDTATVDTITQHHCLVTRHHKLDVLTRLLEVEPFDAMLVFVRTKNATIELAEKLVAHGFTAEALNGDMNQSERERTVDRLKRGRLDILVATDVAARGLDVERIGLVVNYDIPNDPSSYVHRIGRTGRAGREGRALLFVQPRERHLLRAIENTIRQRIPALEPPSADELSAHRIDRFTATVRETVAEEDLDFFYRVVSSIAREQEMEVMDIAAALTFLAQRERPLEAQEPPRGERRERLELGFRREEGEGRGERAGHGPRGERRGGESGLVRYRIEVGRRDGVSPREIVGAIANEAGLEGRHIGRIDIRDDHSILDLPDGMPREVYQHLRRVIVCGKPLNIRLLGEQGRPANDSRPASAGGRGPGGKGKKAGRRERGPTTR
ncbi:MAG: DEAD/DEAH box helicase [Pseudomonadota bacterium]|nr:DEAD/DEAH box helicase [Pseudomonadota bacterium]